MTDEKPKSALEQWLAPAAIVPTLGLCLTMATALGYVKSKDVARKNQLEIMKLEAEIKASQTKPNQFLAPTPLSTPKPPKPLSTPKPQPDTVKPDNDRKTIETNAVNRYKYQLAILKKQQQEELWEIFLTSLRYIGSVAFWFAIIAICLAVLAEILKIDYVYFGIVQIVSSVIAVYLGAFWHPFLNGWTMALGGIMVFTLVSSVYTRLTTGKWEHN